MKCIYRGVAVILLCALLAPSLGVAEAEETEQSRLEALEARVAILEEKLEGLLATTDQAEAAEEVVQSFAVGETLILDESLALTVTSFETGNRFRYSPAGGFATLALTAKSGYRLLCLYVHIENSGASNLSTSQLMDSVLYYGEEYTNRAQENFFYRNSKGVYTVGLKQILPGKEADGCLLFAIPDTVDTSVDQVLVRLRYGGRVYECVLRAGGSLLQGSSTTNTSVF